MIKFGKSNAEYLKAKSYYLEAESNQYWSSKAVRASAKYAEQPARTHCVVCEAELGAPIFQYLGAAYAMCSECGHLNGVHEDTLEFSRFLYEEDHGDAVTAYDDESMETFMGRMRSVYLPKAQFLVDALVEQGEDPVTLRYADLGAGAGHFVVAMQECGLAHSVGYDASATMAGRTNDRFGREIMRANRVEDLTGLVETIEAEVITMIFSLEHVHGLNDFMAALKRNKALKYFYFALPLYTPSALLDVAFPHLAPRVLGLGHTHLFSDRSIDIMCNKFGLRRTAEWWFGANAFDVIRTIGATLRNNEQTAGAIEPWLNQMAPLMDDLQLVFDRHKQSSEVHLLSVVER